MTVARIASPHAVHRAFLPLFLDGLKDHFQRQRRVLKVGDLIGVGIDEEGARFAGGDEDDVESVFLPLILIPRTVKLNVIWSEDSRRRQ